MNKVLFNKVAKQIKLMPIGKVEFILKELYSQGYRDGHSDCCKELGLEDGDETCTIAIDDLQRQLNMGKTVEQIMEEVKR